MSRKFRVYKCIGSLCFLCLLLIVSLCICSCTSENNIFDNNESKLLNFSISVPEWKNNDSTPNSRTRATPISGSSFNEASSFNIIADVYDGTKNYTTIINNEAVSFNNSMWKTVTPHYWPGTANKTVSFYAYYPASIYSSISHTAGSAPTLSYTVPDDVASQIDIMTATGNNVSGNTNSSTPLSFNHIFAAVQFNIGSAGMPNGTITGITLNNILYKGTYSLNGTWSQDVTAKKSFSQTVSVSTNAGTTITSNATTFMMMPQTLGNDASITVTYSNGSTITKTISGTWKSGNIYKYNISYPSRTLNYTGGVQSYTAPATGTYKLEVWGAEENGVKGGYSSGIITLAAGAILYIYVGGAYGDGSYLNGDGTTDIRLNSALIYTPPATGLGTVSACYYGPYWHSTAGLYQVDATGSGFQNCNFSAYTIFIDNTPQHFFTVTKVIKTSSHFTAYINVDIDVTSTRYGGIELNIGWNDVNYDVTISQAAISKLSDRIIVGAGYNSSSSTSGVTNGVSQEHVNSGNGMAKITLLSVP